ncbi:hypothetical protein G6514_008016 [Epicoccum nigrum]|nr:hypothetical protein G6514_008016 [Epicoccum nigrum]
MASQPNDPFDDLLTLEDTLYTSAHAQGITDGARAGRIEGRIFGLEKGFEKFAALGELHGRGAVWGSRIAASTPTSTTSTPNPTESHSEDKQTRLPPIANPSTRLTSNTSLLYHLTDPPTFDTSNNETAVADYDDRFKRAGAKAKVIERIVGETSTSANAEQGGEGANARGVRIEGKKGAKGGKGDDNMEDFAGSRLIG